MKQPISTVTDEEKQAAIEKACEEMRKAGVGKAHNDDNVRVEFAAELGCVFDNAAMDVAGRVNGMDVYKVKARPQIDRMKRTLNDGGLKRRRIPPEYRMPLAYYIH